MGCWRGEAWQEWACTGWGGVGVGGVEDFSASVCLGLLCLTHPGLPGEAEGNPREIGEGESYHQPSPQGRALTAGVARWSWGVLGCSGEGPCEASGIRRSSPVSPAVVEQRGSGCWKTGSREGDPLVGSSLGSRAWE